MKRFCFFLFACFSCATGNLLGQMEFPPSQRELNGYLLAEDAKPISEGFDSLIKEQKYNDGWIDRAYSLDTAQSAYMVFGFSDSSDDCLSIQITGKAGTAMHPFLGLRLGDSRARVNEVLGPPSQVRHLRNSRMEFLQYTNRNYSVELDSLGNLWSIRILGYDGFPNAPSDSLPNLETILPALQSGDPDIILEALAPDVELIVGDSVFTFAGSPLEVVEDPNSRLSQLLYSGKTCLASLDETLIQSAKLDSLSIQNNRLVPMFKFPASSPVKDIVFDVHAGKWRIWEAHLAH